MSPRTTVCRRDRIPRPTHHPPSPPGAEGSEREAIIVPGPGAKGVSVYKPRASSLPWAWLGSHGCRSPGSRLLSSAVGTAIGKLCHLSKDVHQLQQGLCTVVKTHSEKTTLSVQERRYHCRVIRPFGGSLGTQKPQRWTPTDLCDTFL